MVSPDDSAVYNRYMCVSTVVLCRKLLLKEHKLTTKMVTLKICLSVIMSAVL
jgi:hypothetical protein